MLWTNLHGGFVVLPATLAIYLIGSAAETFWLPAPERRWDRVRRYGLLLGMTAAATLVNPYTYRLHQHIFQYLRSDFILTHVQEFQSPNFHTEGMRHFEILLIAGLLSVPALLKRRDVTQALLLLVWAHAALLSARHVLLYVVVASPVVADELSRLWQRAASRGWGWVSTLEEVARDYGAGRYGDGRGRGFAWLSPGFVALLAVLLISGQNRDRLRSEFPQDRFPVKACLAADDRLPGSRVFTTDQWGDYLIYRYYPRLKVFIDGRSDFYGPEVGKDYLRAMNSHHQWPQIFDRYGFDLALLPTDRPLATTIKTHPHWRVRYDDGKALLVERVTPAAVSAAARPARPLSSSAS